MMVKRFSFLLPSVLCSALLSAQESGDSLSVEQLSQAVVVAVRGQQEAPFPRTVLGRDDLEEFSRGGRELPSLLSRTPGVISWSDNGLGTGTSYLRIRGAGDSRINVTLDGVPLNSPEDQCVFWANMNGYAHLLGDVSVQRGVGSSTNGDGAFGGTVALSTRAPSRQASGQISFAAGSYGTMHGGGAFSTGLFGRGFVVDGAWHHSTTDGYDHGTAGSSGSWYGGAAWYGRALTVRYKNIGNYEHTGQAWNGVTAGDGDLSLMDGTWGASTGIRTYADMYRHGLGRFNSLYERLTYGDSGDFAQTPDGKYITERYAMSDGSLWPRTTDNFNQDHNLLSAVWRPSATLTLTGTLHYTYGYGYYEELRYRNKLKKFGLALPGVSRSDFVRCKGLVQHTGGAVLSANWISGPWDIAAGASWQQFFGNHFGRLTYASEPAVSAAYLSDGAWSYYDSDAWKRDGNVFIKALRRFSDGLDAFVDLQYRHVGYRSSGINDKFYEEGSGYYNQPLDIDKSYDFFNPKLGLNWQQGGRRAYASLALSHREPERNNFTDNGSYPPPVAEKLLDLEIGYGWTGESLEFSAGMYYMGYRDQFVQTGAQSDIGEALTTNIARSYRAGFEASVACKAASWLDLEANAALSSNRILDFDEVVEDWDAATGYATLHYDSSTLAFSPSAILNGFVTAHFGLVKAAWHTAFVSRQYLDNTGNRDRSLPAYSLSALDLSYTARSGRGAEGASGAGRRYGIREAVFGLSLGNLFNARVAAGGWVYSALCASAGHDDGNRYYQIGFVPVAGFTAMGSVTLKF